MRPLLLIALCGCNQVFDLHHTDLLLPDAAFPDAPDAYVAPVCPSGPLPAFTGTPNQLASGMCSSYTLDQVRSAAMCGGRVVTGAPESGMFAPATFDFGTSYDQPKLAPTTNTLYVRSPSSSPSFFAFHYDGTSWANYQTVTFFMQTLTSSDEIGVPSDGTGTDRRMVIVKGGQFWEEWTTQDDAGAMVWNIATGGFNAANVGLVTIAHPMLTPDGLRLVFFGTDAAGGAGIYILERADKSPWSGQARLLYSLGSPSPLEAVPFLRADCARLYFTLRTGGTDGDIMYVDP